jgi:ABC-type antimicrobial peptide transport system permease subunit
VIFGATALDTFVFSLVLVVVVAAAAASSLIPARRAARVDPNVALRAL